MPDLSELFKESIGDVPPFDAGALATRARRQRRRQIGVGGGLATMAAAIAVALVIGHSGSSPDVQVRAGAGPSTAASTTEPPQTTTDYTSSSAPPLSTTDRTNVVPPPTLTSIPTLTTLPGERGPLPGDFTGTVTSDATTLVVDSTERYNQDVANVDLWVRNVSNDVVDGSSRETTLGLMCAPLGSDGRPTIPVESDINFWFAVIPPLKPGDEGGRSGTFVPTAEYVGTVTCEAVIVHLDTTTLTLTFIAAVPGVTPATITVEPAGTTTTTGAPTTTVPPTS